MFAYSKYKLHYIEKLVTGEKSTVYRCGTLVDLCRGPHIQNTGKVKTFKIMQVSILEQFCLLEWGLLTFR